jgi:hypothetical protein
MTAPTAHEAADMAYARNSAAAEQWLTTVAHNKLIATPTMQIEAAKVAALLALAAAIRASGTR